VIPQDFCCFHISIAWPFLRNKISPEPKGCYNDLFEFQPLMNGVLHSKGHAFAVEMFSFQLFGFGGFGGFSLNLQLLFQNHS